MNLQDVLDANGMNRNSYNTLDRRTGLPFMKRDLDQSRGRDKYFAAHAVALGSMLALQEAGVSALRSAEAVNDVFHRIVRTVEMIQAVQSPGWSMIHVFEFEDGTWGYAYGGPDDTSLRSDFKSRQTVNVITVLKRLHAVINASEQVHA